MVWNLAMRRLAHDFGIGPEQLFTMCRPESGARDVTK